MPAPLAHLLASAHPAVVHAPIGAVLFLPLALALALCRGPEEEGWLRTGRLLAILGLFGAAAAVFTGFHLARELGGIRPGAWLAHPVRPEPSFSALLRTHQLLALAGFPFGAGCWVLLVRRRVRAAFAVSLLWLCLWGAAGHWGGRMVFKETPAEEAGS